MKSELSATALSEDEQAMVCELVRVCDEQNRQSETVPNRRCAEGTKQSLIAQEEIAVKSELSATAQSIKNLAAFTLAEILLSLTVIGIVAAIALPSLLGNANERAWETQKKALYTRFSQALPLLPSLNGYGTLEGTLSDGENEQNVTVDTATETFIRDGLSKVMKITNICDNEHLADCGFPDKIIPLNNGSAINLSGINSLNKFNPTMGEVVPDRFGGYEQLDTKAAAFETVNGESVLVYYNPNCKPDLMESDYWHYSQEKMCANFVYDLNGKKGPNTVGKDIGFISAIYSTDSSIVAPNPYQNDITGTFTYEEARAKCKEIDENIKIPNLNELTSMFYNKKLLAITSENNVYWTSQEKSSNEAWTVSLLTGRRYADPKSRTGYIRCIKR